jgi:hypothetical protein
MAKDWGKLSGDLERLLQALAKNGFRYPDHKPPAA